MENHIIQYAPYILIVLFFCIKNKIFVTPGQFQEELKEIEVKNEERYKNIIKDVENKFLSLAAFHEFEKRIEDHFKTSDLRFAETTKWLQSIDSKINKLIEHK